METKIGKNFTSLIKDLEKNAPEYNVFYAIFLAETISKKIHPDRDDAKFDQKGLRFRPYEHYVFPPKDIRAFDYKDGIMTFVLNFMGLYGINSPLPRCYHEQIAIQQNIHGPGNVPLQNFLDIFNNRFYWLYYQVWKKYRYYLQLSDDPNNKIVRRVFSFIGQVDQVNEKQPLISKFKLLQLSGILSHRVRNKIGLHILLKEFFPKIKFQVREFIPNRVKLFELPKLGSQHGEHSFQLSKYSILGRSMLDCMGRICIEIGPIDFEHYLKFTPESKNAALLKDLLNLYINDGLEYDVKFVLRSKSMGTVTWNDRRLRLGLSLWLGRPEHEFVEVYYTYERFVGTIQ